MKATVPNFEEFERIVHTTLGDVLQRLHFEGPEVESTPPEIAIRYKSPDCRVTVLYEYGDAPWVKVETRNSTGKWKAQSLDKIAKTRTSAVRITRPAFGEVTHDSVRTLLVAYSELFEKEFGA
jgi:hypothetical protein